ncbi:hypothetical protein ACFU51_01395 [Streptomyces sp. NPDC057430]|uniref:hypothetical protein n=1 Tax=Streptomyces sp. NPDC057430 TaxID=3346131 RepID=UPI00369633BE
MSAENKTPDPIRELLAAVLDAIDLPYDADDYDRRIAARAELAVVVARAALREDPADIAWNVDYLRAQLAAEGVRK